MKHFRGDSFEEIYIAILREIDEQYDFLVPSRGGETSKEILNLTFELTDPRDRLIWNKARSTNYEFAQRFFIWMLNGCEDYEYVANVNPNATKLANNTLKFGTAYGPRICRQLDAVIEELKNNEGSRRAVIEVLNEQDQAMLSVDTKEEYPCTESFTFYIRDNALHMIAKLRSNNMVLTLVYDVYNFTMLQEYVLKRLNSTRETPLSMGTYYHQCGSAHFFESQQGLVNNILSCDEVEMPRK